jgi:putative aldouronate transport system permease protein
METSSKGFRRFANIVLILLSLSCLLPLVLLLMSSLTTEKALTMGGYSFFPKEFGLDAYIYLWFSRTQFLVAYKMTLLTTLVGTLTNISLTILMAYPLSRKTLPGRGMFSFLLFFTLLFNGGLVPTYLVYSQMLHIKDTFLALVIPSLLMNGFGVIVTRTYFTANVPDEIIEAARIDGAGETRILTQVVVPMSKPIVATIALMSGLAYWNDWLNGLYYISTKTQLYTIQNLLNRIITSADFISTNQSNSMLAAGLTVPSVGVRMAIAIVAILPVMVIYPFLQKGFVKGIVIGGVKG